MEKIEFLNKIPDIINHKSSGYGELEIRDEKNIQKCVYYKHKDDLTSYGTYGDTWQDVFDKLSKQLIKDGIIFQEEINK